MKFHLIRTSVLTMAVITSIASSIGIAGAQIQKNVHINPALIKNSHISPIHLQPGAKGNFAPPFGSYQETCRNLYVKQLTSKRFRLSANCRTINGGWQPTAIEYSVDFRGQLPCYIDLANINGSLHSVTLTGVRCAH